MGCSLFGAWLTTIQIYARLLAPNCPSSECYKGTTAELEFLNNLWGLGTE
jgi:hypothetical protein